MEIYPLEYSPHRNTLPIAFYFLVPLILSASTKTIFDKQKMLLAGILLLSSLEIVFIIADIYEWIFSNYPAWMHKKYDVYHLVAYREFESGIYLFVVGFLKKIHPVLIIGIWIWVVTKFKREEKDMTLLDMLL